MNTLDYSLQAVKGLFDEISETYGPVNLVASFGFAAWWRRQSMVYGCKRIPTRYA